MPSRLPLQLASLVILANLAAAQLGPLEPLDPATYCSPNGAARLHVDPSQRYGRGAASYRLTLAGREVWSGEREYTLCGAAVADDGLVCGYAYAAGIYGGLEDALVVAIWAPDGTTRLELRTPCERILSCMAMPGPSAIGCTLARDARRFFLCVEEKRDQSWRVFDVDRGIELPFAGEETVPPDVERFANGERRLEAASRRGPDLAVFPELDATDLGSIALGERFLDVALGPQDRIHAREWQTGNVLVFGTDGRLHHVCRPAPDDLDLPRPLTLASFTVTDAGEVWLGRRFSESPFVRFSPEGERLGLVAPPIEGARTWVAQRGTGRSWLVSNSVHLLFADLYLLRSVERAPDGRWLRDLLDASVGLDGSLAIGTGRFEGTQGFRSPAVHLISADGVALRTVALPDGSWPSNLAWDGERLAVLVHEGERRWVVLLDAHGAPLGRIRPTHPWVRRPMFAAGGRELWLFDGEDEIERRELPNAAAADRPH